MQFHSPQTLVGDKNKFEYHQSICFKGMFWSKFTNNQTWCLIMVEWLVLAVPWDCLRFVIVVFPDHTHLLVLQRRQAIFVDIWYIYQIYLTAKETHIFQTYCNLS